MEDEDHMQDYFTGSSGDEYHASDEEFRTPRPFTGPDIDKHLKEIQLYIITCSKPIVEGSYGITSTSKLVVIHEPHSEHFSSEFKQFYCN